MSQNNFPRIVSLGVLNLDFVMELSNEMIGKKKMGRQMADEIFIDNPQEILDNAKHCMAAAHR